MSYSSRCLIEGLLYVDLLVLYDGLLALSLPTDLGLTFLRIRDIMNLRVGDGVSSVGGGGSPPGLSIV